MKFLILGIFSIILASGIIGITWIASADENQIPSWIKNTVKFWTDDQISDQEFLSAIQYLINNNFIKVDSDIQQSDDIYINNLENMVETLENRLEASERQVTGLQNMKSLYENAYEKLEVENDRLERTIERMANQIGDLSYDKANLKNKLEGMFDDIQEKSKVPKTEIIKEEIHWTLYDSKGNEYAWSMPVTTYENAVVSSQYYSTIPFELPSGKTIYMGDFVEFVGKSFGQVIDEVYDNSYNTEEFIYEVWFITSQLTIYSEDIGEHPRLALETLTRGGGDCEDTAILIADMLNSSSHSRNWKIQLVYFDADNPGNPQTIDHVTVAIETLDGFYMIETTAKTEEAMGQWAGQNIVGWWFDV